MIILKHLRIEHFRLLRKIDIHFPQRGSVLISGPNEAGKSAVFESIYFALYGEPLSSSTRFGASPQLNDLILYGETQASVTLTLAIGAIEVEITRTVNRGEGQNVILYVRRLGIPEEGPITDIQQANKRILTELRHLDGEILRNSCFIEQKRLSRLEELSTQEREVTLRTLLGLERLSHLTEQFELTEQDEQLLQKCKEQLQLAEVQARIPELSEQLGQLEAALDAVTVTEDLAEVHRQEAEIAEQERLLEQIRTKVLEIRRHQNRISQLKKAESILGAILATYDSIAEAQRELPGLERQIAELERSETEELPVLEKRVQDLSDLSSSFDTLEHMAADLLNLVSTIKDLELEVQEHGKLQEKLQELDEQIIPVRLQLEQIQQDQYELEELSRSGRLNLETRLMRLQELAARLTELRQAEEMYVHLTKNREQAQENEALFEKVRKELQETEHELVLVETEAQQVHQQAETLKQHWRQLSLRRQLEEWQRLNGLAQGLEEAGQHVKAADERQEQLTIAAMMAHKASSTQRIIFIACTALFVLFVGFALVLALRHTYLFAAITGMIGLLLAAGAGVSLQNHRRAYQKEQVANAHLQEAASQVRMMIEARDARMRITGEEVNRDALKLVEHEIQSLGGTVPRSLNEVKTLLQQLPSESNGEDASMTSLDMQQQMIEKQAIAHAAGNQVNITMEAVAALRKKYAHLEQQRQQEGWENIDEQLRSSLEQIEQMRQEIIILAGQEGLPIPAFDALEETTGQEQERLPLPLKTSLGDEISATEREMQALEKKVAELLDLAVQVKAHQEALDEMLSRKSTLIERAEYFQGNNPVRQLERAREQQAALRDALKILQDSLRQRVQSLALPFGQAVISNAEANARKQLEALYILLGNRVELQNLHHRYTTLLKDGHESLSEQYSQLAKLSASLGSWIVPLNPFAEALMMLRERCLQEIQEADEDGLLRQLEELNLHETASQEKIALYHQQIEEAQARIAAMLAHRNRPPTSSYTLTGISAVWPLVGQYVPQDLNRLKQDHAAIEQELRQLEEQELVMSQQLAQPATDGKNERTAGVVRSGKIDLEQARKNMEQQERKYAAKKRARLLMEAVTERMMNKMLPRTEYYMQQLLPLLTCGRYHDARLTIQQELKATEDAAVENLGAFQLSVWEPAAGAYLPKSTFSGGTADQISLALRLSFAIAALPRELGAAPGFLLLDEPFSSSDQNRMQALVDIVTGEMLGQHFEQVIFISHTSAFDPVLFPYHVSIADGLIVESNLPVVPAPSITEVDGNDRNEYTLRIPASASVAGE